MRVSVSTIALFALNTIVTALVTSMLMHGQDNSPGGVARGGHPHELNRRSDCPAVVCPRCPAGGEAAAPAAAKCPVCSCAAAGRAGAAVAGGAADSGILRSGIVLDTQRGNVVCGVPVLKTDPATGLLRMPPGVKRVWVDVGTHARAQNTRPELDKPSGKDLMIIGFEPNRFQWGEISTINFSPVVNGHQTGWGYGHERFFAFPAAASNESGYATFHRGNENMCSSLKNLKDAKACGGGMVEEFSVAVIMLQDVLRLVPPDVLIEYIKIDAQGHDFEVVRGIGSELPRVKHIRVEVQLKTVYEGATTKDQFRTFMEQHGFRMSKANVNGSPSEENLDFINASM